MVQVASLSNSMKSFLKVWDISLLEKCTHSQYSWKERKIIIYNCKKGKRI